MIFSLFKRKDPAARIDPQPEEAIEQASPLGYEALAGRLREAHAAFVAKDFEGARAILQELVVSNPEDRTVRAQLGICHCLLGDNGLARDLLIRVVEEEPENADAMRFLAASLFNLGEYVAAMGVLEKAKVLRPNDAELLQLTGDIYLEYGRIEGAIQEYVKASDLNPESESVIDRFERTAQISETRVGFYDEPYPQIAERRRRLVNRMLVEYRKKGLPPERLTTLLAILSGGQATFPKAVEIARKEVDSEAMTTDLENQIFRILLTQGDLELVAACAERAFQRDPESNDPKFLLGRLWVTQGSEQWTAGWRLMSETITISRHFHHSHGVPIWEGQKLGNKTLLVYQDQGIGDCILGFRFLPMLASRGVRYKIWVQPALADLVEEMPGCEQVIRGPQLPGAGEHGCAFAITFFGLIGAMFVQAGEIADPPVVRPAPEYALALRQGVRALAAPRVGLLYGGNPRRRDDWVRSLPEAQVSRLAQLSGISWVNLMVDERPERERVRAAFDMLDPMPQVKNFCETAAVVEELDAIVAVDASVAHVAGLLRKPIWVLAPSIPDWRWQIGETLSPWWPTARVLRSPAPGEWGSVVDRLLVELKDWLAARPG